MSIRYAIQNGEQGQLTKMQKGSTKIKNKNNDDGVKSREKTKQKIKNFMTAK